MAQHGLYTHPKFLELAARLGNRALATGILHLTWQIAYDLGDPVVGVPDAVAYAVDWRGNPMELAEMLVGTGFLEWEDGPNGKRLLKVHDLWSNAPDYVKRKRRRREARRREVSDDVRSVSGQCPVSDDQTSDADRTLAGNTYTHTKNPNPPPCKSPPPTARPDGRRTALRKSDRQAVRRFAEQTGFAAWWAQWPAKRGKAEAEWAWYQIGEVGRAAAMVQTPEYLRRRKDAEAAGAFVPILPNPATYLRQSRWEDRFEVPETEPEYVDPVAERAAQVVDQLDGDLWEGGE